MNQEELEEVVMQLVVNGGDARSNALEAIMAARQGDFAKAEASMKLCEETLVEAHGSQTKLIQDELNGKGSAMSLLMVHAQDHLMNAFTVKDLAVEIIELCKIVHKAN